MASFLPSIDLELSKKLQDREYRKRYFLAESSARIAKQLIELRKRRGLNQTELAQLAETGQPAISRAERADYQNWSFNTLRKLAEAMDARIRVVIEASEDVLPEYEAEAEARAEPAAPSAANDVREIKQPRSGLSAADDDSVLEAGERHGTSRYRKQQSDLPDPGSPPERSTLPT